MKTSLVCSGVLACVLAVTFARADGLSPHPLVPGQENAQELSQRKTLLRTGDRFFGWKYSAKTHQDTSHWQREFPGNQSLSGHAIANTRELQPGLAASPASDAGFDLRGVLPAGYIPTAVVSGDFNEDGKMDFAVSNGGDNTVYVLLGNGDGTFKVPEILYTRGQSPNWITAAKLNSTGHLDLVVTDGDSDSLEVFTGHGDGTFENGTRLFLLQTPTFVVASDMNKDGKMDLVVGLTIDTNTTEPQFETLIGNGAGGFSSSVSPPAIFGSIDGPVPTAWVAVGDLNNDGYTDIVTTADGVGIAYLNSNGGAFALQTTVAPPDGAFVVELGDMDEDGCLDAVQSSGYGFLVISKGTCDGNFTPGPNIAELGDVEPAIKLADVDGDGHLDVIGSGAFFYEGGIGIGNPGGYLVSVLKGDGAGGVNPAKIYRGGTDAYSLAVADFTGDNRPEIITVDQLENCLSLYRNDGSGNYDGPEGEAIGYLTGSVNAPLPAGRAQAVDLNGDGKPDILLPEFGPPNEPAQLTALLNDGTGKFLPAVRTPILTAISPPLPMFVAGNFRGPIADVIWGSSFELPNTIAFFPGNGDGTFGSPAILATPPDPLGIVTGDFNNDGKLDFAVVGSDGNTSWQMDVFLGHGDGSFTELAPQIFPGFNSLRSPQQIVVGDFNHDGKLDILLGLNGNGGWVDSGDDLLLSSGNGDGTFQAPKVLIPHFGAVAVGDLNHDGYLDLVQKKDPSEDIAAELFFSPAVTIYLGQADGTFQQQPTIHLPDVAIPSFDPVLLGDFNGDGVLDIGYRTLRTEFGPTIEARLYILQGNGDGTFFVAGHSYQLQALSAPFVGADFNGDQRTDLIEMIGYSSSFHTIEAGPPPALDITLDSELMAGNTGGATVTLNHPAQSPQTVSLTASDPAIQLPANLSFSAGQQTEHFAFTLGSGYDPTHVVALFAALESQTAVGYTAKPNPNLPIGAASQLLLGVYPLTQNSYSVTPGESFTLVLRLDSIGGYSGAFGSFQCMGLPANASCSFADNSTTLLPGGTAEVNFTVNTLGATFGVYPVQVTSTDGFFQTSSTLTLGIGDFSLQVNPTVLTMGPSGTASTTLSSSSTNNLNEDITLTCNGLPGSTTCGADTFVAGSSSSVFGVRGTQLAAKDYPFQIIGQINVVSHAVNAILRVGDYAASLDKTTVSLPAGQSATFNLTLDSINHYAANLGVFCQPLSNVVTCTVSTPTLALADGGTSVIVLTISRGGASASKTDLHSMRMMGILLGILPLGLVISGKRIKNLLPLIVLVFLLGALSCGGGGGMSGPSNAGGGGNHPQTVTVPVVVQSDFSLSDTSNQKMVGPIAVTLE